MKGVLTAQRLALAYGLPQLLAHLRLRCGESFNIPGIWNSAIIL